MVKESRIPVTGARADGLHRSSKENMKSGGCQQKQSLCPKIAQSRFWDSVSATSNSDLWLDNGLIAV